MIEKLSLYRSFAYTVKTGSISAAAKALGVSQPAVSGDIADLEHTLGAVLFIRTNRGMKLTDEGEILYGNISDAFSFIEAGEDAIRKTNVLSHGHLRIGASDMTLKFFLLDYIGKFCADYPGIKLSVTNNPTPQTIDALREGVIDFGVISEGAEKITGEDIVTVPLREIYDVFVTLPSHPLAQKKHVRAEDLKNYPLIMLEKNTGTRKYLTSLQNFRGLEADIELATSDLIIEFALRGMGIASVVRDFAERDVAAGNLTVLDLECPPPPRHFLLAHLRRRPLSSAAAKLIEMMLEGNN